MGKLFSKYQGDSQRSGVHNILIQAKEDLGHYGPELWVVRLSLSHDTRSALSVGVNTREVIPRFARIGCLEEGEWGQGKVRRYQESCQWQKQGKQRPFFDL